MGYMDSGSMGGSFRGNSSDVPMCGIIINRFENSENVAQFKYDIAAGAGQAVAADPVTVSNQAGGTSDYAISGLNALCGTISAKATTVATTSGFLAQSPTDIVPSAGGEAYPVSGFLPYVALLGSKLRMWLPCDSTLKDVSMQQALAYDFTHGELSAAGGSYTTILPVRLLSAPVDAKKLVYSNSTGLATWTDCKAVMVEL